jgi:Ca2+-binding EF-hand superfamily protein
MDAVVTAVMKAIARSDKSLSDIFQAMDKDGGGAVSQREFRVAIGFLKLQPPEFAGKTDDTLNRAIDATFKYLDKDGSGSIGFQELNAQLNALRALNPGMKRGGSAMHAGSSLSSSTVIHAGPDVLVQFKQLLAKSMQKVINLFHDWDRSGDGMVSRKEFHRAMAILSLEAPSETIDELFGACSTLVLHSDPLDQLPPSTPPRLKLPPGWLFQSLAF